MIAREKSSQHANSFRVLRDAKQASAKFICRTGAFVRVKQYKNHQVCLITRRGK